MGSRNIYFMGREGDLEQEKKFQKGAGDLWEWKSEITFISADN